MLSDSAGASRHSRTARPGCERAKELIATGTVDVLVTWEASRAERKLAGVADLIELCANHGVLRSYKGRTYDPAKSADRFPSASRSDRDGSEDPHAARVTAAVAMASCLIRPGSMYRSGRS